MDSVKNRFYVDLNESAEKEIRLLLSHTTNLWNCLVYHIGDAVLEIARSSKDAAVVIPQIRNTVTAAYRILVLEEDLGIPFQLSDVWKQRMRAVRELPGEVAVNRMEDLIQAYIYVHKKYGDGREYPYAPSLKQRGSTRTIRFLEKDWSVSGDMVELDLDGKKISFRVKGISGVEKGRCSLTITKKRPARMKDFVPDDGCKATSFHISLSAE